jgi:hypothetical protein
MISLVSEQQGALSEQHWDYIERCGAALDELDSHVEGTAFHLSRTSTSGRGSETDDE